MKTLILFYFFLITLFSLGQTNNSIKKVNYYDTLNFKRCCHNCGEIDYCVLDSIYKNKEPDFTPLSWIFNPAPYQTKTNCDHKHQTNEKNRY